MNCRPYKKITSTGIRAAQGSTAYVFNFKWNHLSNMWDIEEYRKAKVSDHITLAQNIRDANPDLAKEFDKVDKAL